MDEINRDSERERSILNEPVPMEEKNTTTADERLNCLVSAVSDSVETVTKELADSQTDKPDLEKSFRFQTK